MKQVGISWITTLGVLAMLAVPALAQERDANPDEIFKKLDANGDGKITSSEVSGEQARYFERLVRIGDRDGNGELTKEEFSQAVRGQRRPGDAPAGDTPRPERGPAPDPEQVAQFFSRLDVNGDGKITLDEAPEPARPMIERLLERAGKGKDGSITKEEFLKLSAQGIGRPGQPGPDAARRGEEFFKRLDANGDGKLTLDEAPEPLKPVLERFLERAGRGKDGSISLEEFGRLQPQGAPGGPDAARRAEEFFSRLDANGDGKLTLDEASEQARPFVERMLERAGKGKDESLSKEEFLKLGAAGGPRPGEARPEGRPQGRPQERRPEQPKPEQP